MKRAILVAGAESSGTRLVSRILIAAGCVGDGDHVQRWDVQLPTEEPLIVLRRSMPHAKSWPDLRYLAAKLASRNYEVTVLVIVRDRTATVDSQIKTGHVATTEQAHAHIHEAYLRVFGFLAESGLPYVIVPYESLASKPSVRALCRSLGLPRPNHEAVFDGNTKHYNADNA